MCPAPNSGNDSSKEERSAFLSRQNYNVGLDDNETTSHAIAAASTSIRQSPDRRKRLLSASNVVYLAGLFVLISKTKSRCTPPKSFNLDEYANSTNSNNYPLSSNSTHRIPKIIHQSYKSLSTLPPLWSATPSRWQTLHPSYEYKFWSDDDNRRLIQNHYPWFLPTYDAYPAPIQRADAARYFAVLHHGGIYADMDIMPIRNVDPLLEKMDLSGNEHKEMIVAETYNLGLTNALFASVPNSTILHRFVRELPSHTRPLHGFEMFVPHFAVLLSTGPTRLWIYLNQNNRRDKILTLNPAGWGQCHQCKQHSSKCIPVEGSFFETTKGGSWHKWDTRIMNFIFCHVHFVVWGALCLLGWVGYVYFLEREKSKRRLQQVVSVDTNLDAEHNEGVGRSEDDSRDGKMKEKNMKYYLTKKGWSVFGSSENFVFFARVLILQYRLPLFCFVILILIF